MTPPPGPQKEQDKEIKVQERNKTKRRRKTGRKRENTNTAQACFPSRTYQVVRCQSTPSLLSLHSIGKILCGFFNLASRCWGPKEPVISGLTTRRSRKYGAARNLCIENDDDTLKSFEAPKDSRKSFCEARKAKYMRHCTTIIYK